MAINRESCAGCHGLIDQAVPQVLTTHGIYHLACYSRTRRINVEEDCCAACGERLDGMWTSTGGGRRMHVDCYNRRHRYSPAATFRHVLYGGADPVLARDLIYKMIPVELADRILAEFNREMAELDRKRCEP